VLYNITGQVFENSAGTVHTCSSSRDGTYCEDSACADQYALAQTTVDDHLTYLGMSVSCAAVSN